MGYKNAKDVLPETLLKEVQKYTDGELLYIPAKSPKKIQWGSRNGAKLEYELRNNRIKRLYTEKKSCQELADMFCLSVDSIRKIIHM